MSKKILITQSGDHPTKFLNSPTTPPFATQTDANQEEGVTKAELDAALATPVDSRPYKVYTALLTQSGTDAPTAIVLENTLGGAIVWTRSSDGVYVGTLAGAFVTNKTFIDAKTVFDDIAVITRISITHTTDAITISNVGSNDFPWPGALINGRYPIEIRVYN